MEKQRGHKKLSRFIVAGLILALWPMILHGALPGIAEQLKEAEERIDSALWKLEKQDKLAEALEMYQAVAVELESLEVEAQSTDYHEQQRVLAYAYLRIGNVLRQMGRSDGGRKGIGVCPRIRRRCHLCPYPYELWYYSAYRGTG